MKRIIRTIWPIIIIALMISVFLFFALKQKELDAFTGDADEVSYTVDLSKETEKQVQTFKYTCSQVALSMDIPQDWQYVARAGSDSFIHIPSGASIQIQVLEYYPQVNNADEQTISESFQSLGYRVMQFERLDVNSYMSVYEKQSGELITDYIEHVLWDRQHVVKITASFAQEHYDKLFSQIWACLESTVWEYEDPIPPNMLLCYQLKGDYEFAVPVKWLSGSTDDSFYAYSEEQGASFTAQLIEDSSLISSISQYDYSTFLSSGRSGFALLSFEQSEYELYAEATYMANSQTQMFLVQYYVTNGAFHYIFTYEFPVDIQEMLSSVRFALGYVRIFYTPDEMPESETESFTESAITAPDTSTSDETEVITEITQVETFAEALMVVGGLSAEQSQYIEQVWQHANAGIPVDARAYKQGPMDKILYVLSDDGTPYYIYVTNDGQLERICVNAENGPVIFTE